MEEFLGTVGTLKVKCQITCRYSISSRQDTLNGFQAPFCT